MPSVTVKLYSVFFKLLLKHRLQNRIQSRPDDSDPFGVTSRPEESVAAVNPSFADGVATKDIHIDPFTSLSVRIFLPESALSPPEPVPKSQPTRPRARIPPPKGADPNGNSQGNQPRRRHSHGTPTAAARDDPGKPAGFEEGSRLSLGRRNSFGSSATHPRNAKQNGNHFTGFGNEAESLNLRSSDGGGLPYRGYAPLIGNARKLPVMLQFHGGGWVSGSNDSVVNDVFCRRMAKLCDVIVVAVGYRLAPENKYPAAFEDGMKVLNWLAKQANLAECSKSMGSSRGVTTESKKSDLHRHIVDTFGAQMVEPWLAAHGDPSRCVLLGVSCGANIADYVARKAVEAGRLLDPVKVVAQVLLYPFFMGSVPTHSEIKLANSYFYDKDTCLLAWKLFLPEEEFSLDHPAANPLISGRGPPLKLMPPTLTVVAEHDWMRDRAIAYSEELRKVNVDAPVYDYKDAVHEFATLDMLIKAPQAQACAEDIAIWVKKYISFRGHEFSY
ncbi:probable carboxylesterase 11 [Syzygium oleosum]|uniref:probable carboxylesterase 11 n=1 Tax=Syzygium oleosum TaxID=219896 RepID=UPI0011D26C24|nr:probable carboxylesterase 11 [Syzygium oleosum]